MKIALIRLEQKQLDALMEFAETSSKNKNLNQVIPINDSRSILEQAMDSKAYIMGLK